MSDIAIAAGLYVLGAAIMLSPLGNHPSFTYNWEQYTAWHVFTSWYDGFRPAEVFDVTDGLMTDSGKGPLVGLPAWLGFRLLGPGVEAMRIPVTLVAALAVPLLWLVGRRLVGRRAAGLAALMLTVAPVWLLYGRTATQVGISLVPMLLTAWVLLDVLDDGPRWWRAIALLQIALVAGIYAYAPIRFLWPIALALLTLRAIRGDSRRRHAIALGVTACVLPLALVLLGEATDPEAAVTDSLVAYYNARGEQLVGLHYQPEHYGQFIDVPEGESARASEPELAARLLHRNIAVLGRLLVDHDTGPTLTNFDNPSGQPIGRLYPGLLFPFLIAGLLAAGRSALSTRRRADIMLLVFAASFTLPILLTSRVHVGRLIFALPFLLLLIARGSVIVATVAQQWPPGSGHSGVPRGRLVFAGLSILLVGSVAWSAVREERIVVPEPRVVRMASVMAGEAPAAAKRGGAVFVTADAPVFEEIHLAELRLRLGDTYDFVDVREPMSHPATGEDGVKPPLYYGQVLTVGVPAGLAVPCGAVVFADRVDAARVVDSRSVGCADPPIVIELPE